MADFTYEGIKHELGRGEKIDGAVYIFKAVEPLGRMGHPPFNVTAKSYDEAMTKLKAFIQDAEVIEKTVDLSLTLPERDLVVQALYFMAGEGQADDEEVLALADNLDPTT